MIASILSHNIRDLRTSKGITQQVMADKLGIDRKTLASYELMKSFPNVLMLENIAEILNVKAYELLKERK